MLKKNVILCKCRGFLIIDNQDSPEPEDNASKLNKVFNLSMAHHHLAKLRVCIRGRLFINSVLFIDFFCIHKPKVSRKGARANVNAASARHECGNMCFDVNIKW